MTREEQILNGFTEMITGLWNNQDLKVPDIETLKSKMTLKEHTTYKQEPCEDYISRQAVIEVLNKMDRYAADELTLCDTEKKFPKNEVFIVDDVYEEIVEQLPSVIPQPCDALQKQVKKWIPISEQLPNLNDYVNPKVWQKKVLITGYLSFDDTKETFVSEAFAKDVVRNTVHNTVVIAWQPLPEPYKIESKE